MYLDFFFYNIIISEGSCDTEDFENVALPSKE